MIKMFGMDVDGVLTDGGIYLGNMDLELKRFHAHDGMGITLVREAGLVPFIITGRTSAAVERRARELGIGEVHQGIGDKLACLQAVVSAHKVSLGEVAYVGDDLADICVLENVGFPIAVGDARDEIKRLAKLVTRSVGGSGAVREACEWVLKLNGQWETLVHARSRDRKLGGIGG
jgi:3-deoxy-D-manno-octulosonate 8-phosphate phosphatase (KDO 8-P phosphatase)